MNILKSIKTVLILSMMGLFLTQAQGQLSQDPKEETNDKAALLKKDIEAILQSFIDDYQNDRHAVHPRIFGIEVPEVDGKWTVNITGKELEPKKWEVTMSEGLPKEPTYVFKAEAGILKAINDGEINGLTAQAKAFASDYAPLDAYEMDGFKPTMDQDHAMNAFSFHFWTKGFPEVIPFRPNSTREAHGTNVSVFYYEKGLRTAWLNMMPGDRARDDAREQAMPFPMMGVVIKGSAKGIVDGQPTSVSEGNTVFIPANVHHKWWNETDEPVELILIMFGEGA
ncbi:MAG: cupin domain-containing protein [Bacteroidota bacterium]